MKNILLFVWLLMGITAFAQVKGYVETFKTGDISHWQGDGKTFILSADSGALKITYNRTSASTQWDVFHFGPPSTIDMSSNALITVKVKSNVKTVLTLKPIYQDNTSDWIQYSLTADYNWYTIPFYTTKGVKVLKEMYLYLDGGTTSPNSGIVKFEELRFGDSAFVPVDLAVIGDAINAANLLIKNTMEGNNEGEYPAGSKTTLQTALDKALAIQNSGTKDQKIIEQGTWDLYDACVNYEKSVKASSLKIYDNTATRETRYLYLNLDRLMRSALIFGMHDATGYGVGWSGDNDRSDVKSVCGDYPGLFAEDLNKVERDMDVKGLRYRLTAAYSGGAVVSMVWHQYDPDNRGFYATDVNNERIVSTILPGGSRHSDYTAKLKKVAGFFKSLRGKNGECIPILFRPYHEHYGNWFWWGTATTSTQEYNALWQFTADYLRDSMNVHNLVYTISPSLDQVGSGTQYFDIYPGDNYVDIFGTDFYFGDNITDWDKTQFLSRLQTIARHAVNRNKIAALAEVGEEGLKTADFFTNVLLKPLKNDTVANKFVYAAVWRNESTSHFFAPYPGQLTVPDFLQFYNDPYTLFEKDLPKMYVMPTADTIAPVITTSFDSAIISPVLTYQLKLDTDERAFIRYSAVDQVYDDMPGRFDIGEGGYSHTANITGKQGVEQTLFIRALDAYGNKQKKSTVVKIMFDTLQRAVAWTDAMYPVKDWGKGLSPMGTNSGSATILQSCKTVYFRKDFTITKKPSAMGILVSSYGGGVVYINNKEVGRINIPAGTDVQYSTEPTSNALFNKILSLDSTALAPMQIGKNTIAIEIHVAGGSTVQKFDARAFDAQYTDIIPLSSEWSYYDKGFRPADMKLKDILSGVKLANEIPTSMKLYACYPNPFNPSTVIKYSITKTSNVVLEVYDVLGRRVASLLNKNQQAGVYETQFNAGNLSSGLYIVYLKAGNFISAQKIMLLK